MEVDGGALVFREGGERIGTVPMAPLERVFLRGDVALKANVLAKLGKAGVGVVVLSGIKAEPVLLMPKPHGDAFRRIAQYQAFLSAEIRRRFAGEIVAAKLTSQRNFLEELRSANRGHEREIASFMQRLEDLLPLVQKAANLAELLGIEGKAAAEYFSAFKAVLPASLRFTGRNRRPPRDPFNAVLSLGYTLLHAESVKALHGVGLDPYIGFFHALDYGRESLACDFVEAFRVHADRFAFQSFRDGTLRPEDFTATGEACSMGKAGRERFYAAWEGAVPDLRRRLERTAVRWADAIVDAGSPPTSAFS